MKRLERARELVEEIKAILTGEGIESAHVTVDALEIRAALESGPVVVVQPPDMKFITETAAEIEWEIHLIGGPPDDLLTAWGVLDDLIDALELPLGATEAKTATYQHNGLTDHPAYILNFIETI